MCGTRFALLYWNVEINPFEPRCVETERWNEIWNTKRHVCNGVRQRAADTNCQKTGVNAVGRVSTECILVGVRVDTTRVLALSGRRSEPISTGNWRELVRAKECGAFANCNWNGNACTSSQAKWTRIDEEASGASAHTISQICNRIFINLNAFELHFNFHVFPFYRLNRCSHRIYL